MRREAHAQHLTAPASGRGDLKFPASQPENSRTAVREKQQAAVEVANNATTDGRSFAHREGWWQTYITHYGERPSLFAEVTTQGIPIQEGKTRLLDIGCGPGTIGIYGLMEKKALSATFTDIRSEQIDLVRENVALRISEGKLRESQVRIIKRAISFTELSDEELDRHDLCSFNPPQLPCDYVDEDAWRKIASDPVQSAYRIGGPDGLNMARKFFEWFAEPHRPKPDAVVILSSFLGRKLIERTLNSHKGIRWAICKETPGIPLRPFFLKEKINALTSAEREDRSLKPDGTGWWTKTLFLMRLMYGFRG